MISDNDVDSPPVSYLLAKVQRLESKMMSRPNAWDATLKMSLQPNTWDTNIRKFRSTRQMVA